MVESKAIRAVVEWYENDGWIVKSVERDRCGFDLQCAKNDTSEDVEVKGVRGSKTCFMITQGEVHQARTNPRFVLRVVTRALSQSSTIVRYSGREFERRFRLSPIQYRAVPRTLLLHAKVSEAILGCRRVVRPPSRTEHWRARPGDAPG